jgi:hypothetical protein
MAVSAECNNILLHILQVFKASTIHVIVSFQNKGPQIFFTHFLNPIDTDSTFLHWMLRRVANTALIFSSSSPKCSFGLEEKNTSVDQPHKKETHSIIWALCGGHSARPPRPIHRPIKWLSRHPLTRSAKCRGAPSKLRALISKHSTTQHYLARSNITYFPLVVYYVKFIVLQVLAMALQLIRG